MVISKMKVGGYIMSRPKERTQFIPAKKNHVGRDLFLFKRGKHCKYFFDEKGEVYGANFQRSEKVSEAAKANNQKRFKYLMEKQG